MPNPEDWARENIDRLLTQAGWAVRDQSEANILDYRGVAIRNFTLKPGHGFADYLLYVDGRAAGKKWVIIPASKIWYFEMPSALGGRNGYKRTLRKLRKFNHPAPRFWREDLERGEQSKNFDFQQYVKNSEIYFRRVTKIGVGIVATGLNNGQ